MLSFFTGQHYPTGSRFPLSTSSRKPHSRLCCNLGMPTCRDNPHIRPSLLRKNIPSVSLPPPDREMLLSIGSLHITTSCWKNLSLALFLLVPRSNPSATAWPI